jgi:tannase/feruloyl esterase
MRTTGYLALFLLALSAMQASAEDSCEKLASLKISNATITLAQSVAAGTFNGPPAPFSGVDISSLYKTLPAFCRVTAEAKPTADSDIKMEIWLPASGWNGKLQGIGNGGFAGLIDDMQIGIALKAGYAATATDTGHAGSPIDAAWAVGHPEKVVDFGHRGIHEMTRVAKAVVQAYYGKTAQHSYFAGCSDGGREALMEAQRYPEDYDGILAGAPANYWTRLLALAAYDTQALTKDAGSFIPKSKIAIIAAAVNASCDDGDGVKDGVLNDPRQCKFDPKTIECKAAEDADKCLTAPQVAALKALYDGLRDSKGQLLFPGYLPGAEDGSDGWGLWITGPAPAKSLMAFFGQGYFSDLVYEKSDWNFKTFNVDTDLKAAEAKTAAALNAINPNLKAFKARGGKLILYHGWNDPAIPALNTINYYESVIAKMGRKDADSFVRLYMVPGMLHCAGGPGADSFGQVEKLKFDDPHSVDAALEQWVEKGSAPGTIIASKFTGEDKLHPSMTRPLCVYPQAAKYKGSGDPNAARSFTCQK